MGFQNQIAEWEAGFSETSLEAVAHGPAPEESAESWKVSKELDGECALDPSAS